MKHIHFDQFCYHSTLRPVPKSCSVFQKVFKYFRGKKGAHWFKAHFCTHNSLCFTRNFLRSLVYNVNWRLGIFSKEKKNWYAWRCCLCDLRHHLFQLNLGPKTKLKMKLPHVQQFLSQHTMITQKSENRKDPLAPKQKHHNLLKISKSLQVLTLPLVQK